MQMQSRYLYMRRYYCLRLVRPIAPQWLRLLFKKSCGHGMHSTSYSHKDKSGQLLLLCDGSLRDFLNAALQ